MAGVLRQTMNSLSRRLWATDTPYGGTNTFVVVDTANLTALTAAGPFGLSWTGGTATGAVAVAGGLSGFMAPRSSTTQVFYSADGIGWTQRTFPTSRNWTAIATNGTRFVALASGTNIATYSDDKGVTWNTSTLPASQNWSAITCNLATGIWIAVASSSSTIARSVDGATWTSVTVPSASAWSCITSTNTAPGRFVALAQNSSNVIYSTNGGTTWLQSTGGLNALNYKIAYGGGLFVSASRNLSNYATSPDGITWTNRTPPALTGGMAAIAYGNGRFVTVGLNQSTSYYSLDGISWTSGGTLPTSFGQPGQWVDVCFA